MLVFPDNLYLYYVNCTLTVYFSCLLFFPTLYMCILWVNTRYMYCIVKVGVYMLAVLNLCEHVVLIGIESDNHNLKNIFLYNYKFDALYLYKLSLFTMTH